MRSIIVAMSERNRAIGRNNDLPWKDVMPVPNPDMRRFKQLTTGHPVIMGRRTWDSLPERFRPLPNRENIILSRRLRGKAPSGVWRVSDLKQALELAEEITTNEEVFIIGGAQVYAEALPLVDRLYLTLVDVDEEGDRFFPDYSGFSKVISREVVPDFAPRLTFLTLERP